MHFSLAILFALTAVVRSAQAEAPPALLPDVVRWLITPAEEKPNPLIAADATATTLDQLSRTAAHSLAGRFEGAVVLAGAVYEGTPQTMAGDLSDQLSENTEVPAASLKPLLIDSTRVEKGNKVAAQWIGDLLRAGATDYVGVCVLWHADLQEHSVLDGASPKPQLVMVLFSASRDAENVLRVQRFGWGTIVSGK
ncbi:MAG TPA: hypothetical protein VGB55_14435 [Tepidisphaeraceae bacterium]|jgi:hypothetical protein